MNPFMALYQWEKKNVYRLLPETPHSSLDSPARTSQWKPWRWKRRDEMRKEFMRRIQKKRGVALCRNSLRSFQFRCSYPPLPFPLCQPLMYVRNVCRHFSKTNCHIVFCHTDVTWQKSQALFCSCQCQVFPHFTSSNLHGTLKTVEHEILPISSK